MDQRVGEARLWLRNYSPAPGADIRLVCFPHAGGAASAYHPMAKALSPSVDVSAVQYPGRQDRRTEPCAESLAELADRIVPVLSALDDDRPLALFGHSMGATVAYEVARRLERSAGTPAPVLVLLSGRRPPHHATQLGGVHLRDDAGVLRELSFLGGSVMEALADPELLELVMPAIRGDYRAVETYVHVPGPPLRCPVVALTGDADPRASVAEVEDWREYTTGTFGLHVFPGGHFYLQDRGGDDVHETVRAHLAGLTARGAGPR
ncbi:thioesterase II family protein [Streptomyces clavuligerus]|uniref:Thioesterase n=2 Tax=Streptomyces clavuligerus TaxID=1901 RepID=B5H3V9_STRCL|nr:alpha/beta fold hydrolase [Streptomyces clavuligerus]ANW16850.1 oleoyl-ACP hydrolase [Streptomyces clavuligerus]AXU11379.1 thioesterase [Streptomyces clavuligerus]EDY53255.1 thioesterase [Streptomyces clavuligerus]EFG10634.1 Thioesterase [Streptomyces clavuligerus]MBY6301192.1 thioesterase [Streptomyces clavuligerus]